MLVIILLYCRVYKTSARRPSPFVYLFYRIITQSEIDLKTPAAAVLRISIRGLPTVFFLSIFFSCYYIGYKRISNNDFLDAPAIYQNRNSARKLRHNVIFDFNKSSLSRSETVTTNMGKKHTHMIERPILPVGIEKVHKIHSSQTMQENSQNRHSARIYCYYITANILVWKPIYLDCHKRLFSPMLIFITFRRPGK